MVRIAKGAAGRSGEERPQQVVVQRRPLRLQQLQGRGKRLQVVRQCRRVLADPGTVPQLQTIQHRPGLVARLARQHVAEIDASIAAFLAGIALPVANLPEHPQAAARVVRVVGKPARRRGGRVTQVVFARGVARQGVVLVRSQLAIEPAEIAVAQRSGPGVPARRLQGGWPFAPLQRRRGIRAMGTVDLMNRAHPT